jgi:capsular exopolysaccharide synthesis family protein
MQTSRDPVEPYDGIVNNLLSADGFLSSKVWLVTSAGPREGKTVTVMGLGHALAKRGRKVLLIDGNLRGPRLHNFFKLEDQPGLADILQTGMEAQRTIKTAGSETGNCVAHIIPAGRATIDPFEILGSHRMRQFLQEVKDDFDFVLIDSPAVDSFIDPLLLVPLVDAVVLVAAYARTRRYSILAARDRITKLKGKVAGVVLNCYENPIPSVIEKLL